jgi:hypothetical protein
MVNTIDEYGLDRFDTLVCWMGCNERGDFTPYEDYYRSLLDQGKQIVLLNVGPTLDSSLKDYDAVNYPNELMLKYNAAQAAWAAQNNVRVIDMYTYLTNNITINPDDGIHYDPKPTTTIWEEILRNL